MPNTSLKADSRSDSLVPCARSQRRSTPSRVCARAKHGCAAVDLARLGCYAKYPQTNKLQWDDTVRAMWGLPAGGLVDYDGWGACVYPDDLSRVGAAVPRGAGPRSDGGYEIEYRGIGKKDGGGSWVAGPGTNNFR